MRDVGFTARARLVSPQHFNVLFIGVLAQFYLAWEALVLNERGY